MSEQLSPAGRLLAEKILVLLRAEYRDSCRARTPFEKKLSVLYEASSALEPAESRAIRHILRPIVAYSNLGIAERGHRIINAGLAIKQLVESQPQGALLASAKVEEKKKAPSPSNVDSIDKSSTPSSSVPSPESHQAVRPQTKGTATAKAEGTAAIAPVRLPPATRPAPVSDHPLYSLSTRLEIMQHMPSYTANCLSNLELYTIKDMLEHYPRRWEERTRITPIGRVVDAAIETIVGKVVERRSKKIRPRFEVTEVVVSDSTGTLTLVWFNQKYVLEALPLGRIIVASGKIECSLYGNKMHSPETENATGPFIHTNRIVPVYKLSGRMVQSSMRKWMYNLVPTYAPMLAEPLPAPIIEKYNFPLLSQATVEYHFPSSYESRELARKRLAYDELLTLQLRIGLSRMEMNSEPRICFYQHGEKLLEDFLQLMPFAPTGAQARVFRELLGDLSCDIPMNRLLQGDVGSGKTMVAAFACFVAIKNGYQAAIMAPTEILAEQHYRKLSDLLAPAGIHVGHLQGSMTRKQKATVYVQAATSQVDLLVGTHALIQESLKFANLSLVVIDEQHKFGVMQRTTLRQKGLNPDLLVMTATPIPRTLSLTLYGDLDVSKLDELPPGRQPIQSSAIPYKEREKAYELMRQEISNGRQGYVVCPLIDETDKIEATAAIQEAEEFRTNVFPEFKVGLLHGKMKASEKDEIMEAFRRQEFQLLISTTVIEVGVDVPNATIMLVRDADRFGLSQLHQLRGRIGRGSHASYCLFMGQANNDYGQRKLKAIAKLSDGFEVAEEDLEIRGPGDYYGVRQAGMPELKVADLIKDKDLLIQCRQDATVILREDQTLSRPCHRILKSMITEYQAKASEMVH